MNVKTKFPLRGSEVSSRDIGRRNALVDIKRVKLKRGLFKIRPNIEYPPSKSTRCSPEPLARNQINVETKFHSVFLPSPARASSLLVRHQISLRARSRRFPASSAFNHSPAPFSEIPEKITSIRRNTSPMRRGAARRDDAAGAQSDKQASTAILVPYSAVLPRFSISAKVKRNRANGGYLFPRSGERRSPPRHRGPFIISSVSRRTSVTILRKSVICISLRMCSMSSAAYQFRERHRR